VTGAIVEAVSGLCLIAGGVLVVIGSLGLLRLPDFFTRMHAAGITDTLGAGLILLGLGLKAGFILASFKLVLLFVLLIFTSPTATHALARAARHGKLRPILHPRGDDP
jgi:multicomponent Na+:H+ antiporter subunit G